MDNSDTDIEKEDFNLISSPLDNDMNKKKYKIEKFKTSEPNLNFKSVNMADKNMEALTVFNIDVNDLKAYACIVSNGYSFRLSLAYISLNEEKNNFKDSKIDIITKKAGRFNNISLSLLIFVSVCVAAIILITIFTCFYLKYHKYNFFKCCLNAANKRDNKFFKGNNIEPKDKLFNTHDSLQKGFEAMKNNLLYPYAPASFIDKFRSNDDGSMKHTYYINDVLVTSSNNNSHDSERQLLNSFDGSLGYDAAYINMIQQLIDDKDYLVPYEK